jgi:hypothetical protein
MAHEYDIKFFLQTLLQLDMTKSSTFWYEAHFVYQIVNIAMSVSMSFSDMNMETVEKRIKVYGIGAVKSVNFVDVG